MSLLLLLQLIPTIFYMVSRCSGLNVAGSQFPWQIWLLHPQLRRFSERQCWMCIQTRFKELLFDKNILQRRFLIFSRYLPIFCVHICVAKKCKFFLDIGGFGYKLHRMSRHAFVSVSNEIGQERPLTTKIVLMFGLN